MSRLMSKICREGPAWKSDLVEEISEVGMITTNKSILGGDSAKRAVVENRSILRQ